MLFDQCDINHNQDYLDHSKWGELERDVLFPFDGTYVNFWGASHHFLRFSPKFPPKRTHTDT